MKVPQFYIKGDAALAMFEVTDATQFHRSGESFQYSDEDKAGRAELLKALAKVAPRPERPERPADLRTQAQLDKWTETWKAYLDADAAWGKEVHAPIYQKVFAKWRKKFEARLAATPAGLVRVDVGPGGPVLARNLPKRLRRVIDVDARKLHALDRKIAALQVERGKVILEAFQTGDQLTPDMIVAVADLPAAKRGPHRTDRIDLDGMHMVTAYAIEKRRAA